jgi:hypothetical protein
LPCQDFGCKVLGCPAKRVGRFVERQVFLAETEIGECNVTVRVKQDVLSRRKKKRRKKKTNQYLHSVGVRNPSKKKKKKKKKHIATTTHLRFQIPVHNIIPMQMLQRQNQFTRVKFRPRLTERRLLLQMIKQFTPIHVIQHEVEFFRGLETEFETHEEGTRSLDEDVAFGEGVRDFLAFHYIFFDEHFHGVDTT